MKKVVLHVEPEPFERVAARGGGDDRLAGAVEVRRETTLLKLGLAEGDVLIDQVMSGNAGNNLRHFFGATRDTASLLWTVVFAPILNLAATALILFYYSRLRSNRSLFRLSLLPLCLLALSAGLEFMEAKTLSSFAQDPMVRYRQFIFIEEMAELVAASLFVWIHYHYAMCWRAAHYQFSDAGEL